MEGNFIALKKEARLKVWQEWIAAFVDDNPDADPIPHAAELLNDYYWRLHTAYLKPLLKYSDDKEHNLHYYKIISASEITVMAVVPFKNKASDEVEDRKQLNADFACYIAYFIMGNWKIDGQKYIDDDRLLEVLQTTELIDRVSDEDKYYPQSLMDEHIEWLKDLNTATALPILSNAQTWRAIFLASQKAK